MTDNFFAALNSAVFSDGSFVYIPKGVRCPMELSVLDETDSGLDIDALKTIAHGINQYRREDRAIILITHYQRLLKYAVPDHVHVLMDGHIVKSGGKELALELEEKGYSWLE